MSYLIKQSSTARPLMFLMVQSADHITPLTGATPTVTISKNGGAFAAPAGAVTEVANGWYKVAGNATDSNTLGPLALHATATSGDPCDAQYEIVAYDPHDAAALGLTNLDALISSRMATFTYTAPDNASITGIKAKTDNLPADPASNTQVNTRLSTAGYTAPDNAGVAAIKAKTDNLPADPASTTNVNTRLASASYVAPDNTSIGAIKAKTDNLPVDPASNTTVNTRLASAGYTAPDNATIAAINAKTTALPTDPADASDIAAAFGTVNTNVLSRLAASSYLAPDNTGIAAIKAKTDNLPLDPADASDLNASLALIDANVSSRLASSAYLAPDNTGIAAIKLKTDNLPTDPADASVLAGLIAGLNADVLARPILADITGALPTLAAIIAGVPSTAAINTALSTAHGAGSWLTGGGSGGGGATAAELVAAIIASGARLTTRSSVDDDANVLLWEGQSYTVAHNNALVLSDRGGRWPSLVGATAVSLAYTNPEGGPPILVGEGTVLTAGTVGEPQTVQIELTLADVASVAAGYRLLHWIATLADGDPALLAVGTLAKRSL